MKTTCGWLLVGLILTGPAAANVDATGSISFKYSVSHAKSFRVEKLVERAAEVLKKSPFELLLAEVVTPEVPRRVFAVRKGTTSSIISGYRENVELWIHADLIPDPGQLSVTSIQFRISVGITKSNAPSATYRDPDQGQMQVYEARVRAKLEEEFATLCRAPVKLNGISCR